MSSLPKDYWTAGQIASKHFELTGEIVTPSVVGVTARKIGAQFKEVDDMESMYGPRKVFTDPQQILRALKEKLDGKKLSGKAVNVIPAEAKTASEIADLYLAKTGRTVSTAAVYGASKRVRALTKKVPSPLGGQHNVYCEVEAILGKLTEDYESETLRQSEMARVKAETPEGWVCFRMLRDLIPEKLQLAAWHERIYADAAAKLGQTPVHGHYSPAWADSVVMQVQIDLGAKNPEAGRGLQAMLEDRRTAVAEAQAAEQARLARAITPWPDDWPEDAHDCDPSVELVYEGGLKCAISYNKHCRVTVAWSSCEAQNSNQYLIDIEDARSHRVTLVLSGDCEFSDFVRGIAKIREEHPSEGKTVRSKEAFLTVSFSDRGLWIEQFDQGYCFIKDSVVHFVEHDYSSRTTPRTLLPIELETVNLIAEAASFREEDGGLVLATNAGAQFVPRASWIDVNAEARELAELFKQLHSSSRSVARKSVLERLAEINRLAAAQYAKQR